MAALDVNLIHFIPLVICGSQNHYIFPETNLNWILSMKQTIPNVQQSKVTIAQDYVTEKSCSINCICSNTFLRTFWLLTFRLRTAKCKTNFLPCHILTFSLFIGKRNSYNSNRRCLKKKTENCCLKAKLINHFEFEIMSC